jgi:hypothetical protein
MQREGMMKNEIIAWKSENGDQASFEQFMLQRHNELVTAKGLIEDTTSTAWRTSDTKHSMDQYEDFYEHRYSSRSQPFQLTELRTWVGFQTWEGAELEGANFALADAEYSTLKWAELRETSLLAAGDGNELSLADAQLQLQVFLASNPFAEGSKERKQEALSTGWADSWSEYTSSADYQKAHRHRSGFEKWMSNNMKWMAEIPGIGPAIGAGFHMGQLAAGNENTEEAFLGVGDTSLASLGYAGVATNAKDAYENANTGTGAFFAAGGSVAATLVGNKGGDAVSAFFEGTGANRELNKALAGIENEELRDFATSVANDVTNPFQAAMNVAYAVLAGPVELQKALGGGSTEAGENYEAFLHDMGFESFDETANREVNIGDNINAALTIAMLDGFVKTRGKGKPTSASEYAQGFREHSSEMRAQLERYEEHLLTLDELDNPPSFDRWAEEAGEEKATYEWEEPVEEEADTKADKHLGDGGLNDKQSLAHRAAERVYNGPNELFGREIGEGFELRDELSTEEHAVWVNKQSGKVMVSFRGTANFGKDLVSDAQLMVGGESLGGRFAAEKQWFQESVLPILDELNQRSDGSIGGAAPPLASVDLTGHSLGGTLVQYINREFPDAAIGDAHAFNPGSSLLANALHEQLGNGVSPLTSGRLTNIVQHGDPISMDTSPYGTTLTFDNGIGRTHSLSSFRLSERFQEGANPYTTSGWFVDGTLYGMHTARQALRNTRLQQTAGKGAARSGASSQDDDSTGYTRGQDEGFDAMMDYFGLVDDADGPSDGSSDGAGDGGACGPRGDRRQLKGGKCGPPPDIAPSDSDPSDDWVSDDPSYPPTGADSHAPPLAVGRGLPSCVFEEHYHELESLGGVGGGGGGRDEPPLGFFIYDASQDFHGQVVVF